MVARERQVKVTLVAAQPSHRLSIQGQVVVVLEAAVLPGYLTELEELEVLVSQC
jgi:hypothetical protein